MLLLMPYTLNPLWYTPILPILFLTSAIAVGLGIFIFIDSWLLGLEQESERNLIWYESSYARVLNEGYWEEKDQLPLDYVIEDPGAVVETLREMKIPAAARTVFGGELILREDRFEQGGAMPVKIYAIDPDRVPAGKVLDTFIEVLWVQKGKSFIADLDAQPPQVIAGTESYDAPDYSTDPVVSGTLLATLPYYIIEKDAERSEQVRIVFPDPTPEAWSTRTTASVRRTMK